MRAAFPGAGALAVLVLFCAAVIFEDLKHGRVPNILNAAGLATGLALSFLSGGVPSAAASAAGVLLGASILLVPFLLHMVGGGDVKFLAAAGSLVGWRLLPASFLLGAALGGATGLLLLAFHDRSPGRLRNRLIVLRSGMWRPPRSTEDTDRERAQGPERGVRRPTGDVSMPYTVPLSVGLITVTSLHVFT